ncbi:MAG: sugar phosphate isomerase/epimerase [Desulfobacterales bacterium]|nr:MAG: sugar phosphate isomerase/epimerase [Desulfobacterales bacterium]
MLALSTSWKSTETIDGKALLAFLEYLDISGIELEYRISEPTYRQMREALKRSRLKVVSVHNFFPKPSIKPDSKASGDFFMLSSLDDDERQRAVQWTIKTIETAAEVGAAAVVLHCGRVEMERELDVLYQFFRSNQILSQEAQAFIGKKLKERDRLKPQYLENLLFSLDQLSRVAEKYKILLALENRFHYDELPAIEDFEAIFRRFEGTPLGYWHDVGHAQVNENLSLFPPGSLLKNYADRLIGIHLHDAVGIEDHLAPGTGEIDFMNLKSYLKADTLTVLELKPRIPEFEVIQGIRFVREKILN